MQLKYGNGVIKLPLEEKNILKVLHLKEQEAVVNPEYKLKELLNLVLEKPALNQKKILLIWVKEKNLF